ncbi:MAG: o-succinylbenzoate synthase [Bacteroides sp.]|nr:o-succinylbenzoate synthase [Bacteroides sp.]
MNRKDTYYLKLCHPGSEKCFGLGEAGLFRGLSYDDRPDFERFLTDVCHDIDRYAGSTELLSEWPSVRFAVETAFRDLNNGGRRLIFPSDWTERKSSLTINGLVWMGNRKEMRERIASKLSDGFSCVKIKIGGIDFNEELNLLEYIRKEAPKIELRLDANGAFTPANAIEKLKRLSEFDIHSIEQPIRAGQWEEMKRLCKESPIPIALDEELIGLNNRESKQKMLDIIRPQYIILKPTLTGGFASSDEWIDLANSVDCGWWATSALESNIGLNAIAQWVATHKPTLPQGLGTGQLYHNNIHSPLCLNGEHLFYGHDDEWIIPGLTWS